MAGAALVMGVLCGSLAVVYRCLAADGKRADAPLVLTDLSSRRFTEARFPPTRVNQWLLIG